MMLLIVSPWYRLKLVRTIATSGCERKHIHRKAREMSVRSKSVTRRVLVCRLTFVICDHCPQKLLNANNPAFVLSIDHSNVNPPVVGGATPMQQIRLNR